MGILPKPLTDEEIKMDKVTIVMKLKKSTKGTHVYGNEDSAIPSVYIKKEIFQGKSPAEIVVTLEDANNGNV